MTKLLVLSLLAGIASAQTAPNIQGQTNGTFDLSPMAITKPFSVGSSLPSTCTIGQMYFDSAATAGKNLYGATSSSPCTWSQQGGAGGGSVTSFSAGALSPIFSTSVATATTTPALSFTLSNAAQNSVLAGPASGGAGAPSYQTSPTISGTNITGLPIAGITGLGTGVGTALAAAVSGTGSICLTSGSSCAGAVTLTSPATSINISGSGTSTLTVDVSTTYLNSLYAQLAASNTFIAGAIQTFTPSSTAPGIVIVPGSVPSAILSYAGAFCVTATGIPCTGDGTNVSYLARFIGSGTTAPATPTTGHLAGVTSAYGITDLGALGTGVLTALGTTVSGSGAICLASGSACGSGSSPALSALTAAAGSNTIASGNNGAQVWNWAQTTNSQTAFTFGETTAATGTSDLELAVKTLAGSTAVPLTLTDSLTGSQTLAALQILPTWNTSGVVDAGIFENVTNTASGTGSKLIDLQLGGTSQFAVDKAGNVTTQGSIGTGSSAPTCGSGVTGCVAMSEGSTGATPASSVDTIRADSTAHDFKISLNNAAEVSLGLGGTCTNQVTTALAAISGVPTCTTITSAYVDSSIAPSANAKLNTDSSLGTSMGSGFYLPGTSLTAGDVYYQASGGLTVAEANASTTVPAICIAISTTQCMTFGTYRFASTQSWTSGQLLYVSDASAGAILNSTPTTSGHYVQRIGVALAADTIQFMPSVDVGGIQ